MSDHEDSSSSDSEIELNDEDKSFMKTMRGFQERVYGYDGDSAALYDQLESSESEEEILEEEEDIVFDILEAAVSDVAEVIKNDNKKFTLLFDEEVEKLELEPADSVVDFEYSNDKIPYLQDWRHLRPFAIALGKARPETKGTKLNIEDTLKITI